MTAVLAIALHSLQQDMGRLDRISMNLANAMTPGYKREVATPLPVGDRSFTGWVDALASSSGVVGDASASPAVSDAARLVIQTDRRAGTLRSTGQRLDVALAGEGFFEVRTEAGPAYTRSGAWQLDAQSRLVTAQGDPVMGEGGEIVLSRPDPRIDADGQVFEAEAANGATPVPVAQLKVVRFERPEQLQRLGGGLFSSTEAGVRPPDGAAPVKQGFLENSNVDPMLEMVQLIRSMRHFESMQKVALGYDEMIGTAVRKLGELS